MSRLVFRIGLSVAIVILSYMGMNLMKGFNKPQQKKQRPPQLRTVRVLEAKFAPQDIVLQGLGKIKAKDAIELRAEVAGYVKPESFKFRTGADFNMGDVLWQIDDRQARLQYQSSLGDLMAAMAGFLPEAKADLPAEVTPWETFFSKLSLEVLPELPQSETDNISPRMKMYLSRFNIYKLYFAAKNLEIQLQKHAYKAPYRGNVIQSDIRPGGFVNIGAVLGRINNTSGFEIEVPMAVSNADWIDMVKEASFKVVESGVVGRALVKRKTQSIAGREQSVQVVLEVIPNSLKMGQKSIVSKQDKGQSMLSNAKLLEGGYADVFFQGKGLAKAIVMSAGASYADGYVYQVKGGVIKKAVVEIAKNDGYNIYITGGVSEGDTIVVEPLQDAVEGMKVNVRTEVKL